MRDLLVEPVVPITDRCVLWSSKVPQVNVKAFFYNIKSPTYLNYYRFVCGTKSRKSQFQYFVKL